MDFLNYFKDPKPWDCKAYASTLPVPQWSEQATCGLVPFEWAVHGLQDMENEESKDVNFAETIAVFPYEQSFFRFVEDKILGKDLESRVKSCFKRSLPTAQTAGAYREFFNTTKRNVDMAQDAAPAEYMHGTALDVMEHFIASVNFKNMLGAYCAAAGFAAVVTARARVCV